MQQPSPIGQQHKLVQHQKALYAPLGYGFGAALVALSSIYAPFSSPMYIYAGKSLCLVNRGALDSH